MELVETSEVWKQRSHVMTLFGEVKIQQKQSGFMSKFLSE